MKKLVFRLLVLGSVALNIALLVRGTSVASPGKPVSTLTADQAARIREIRSRDDSRRIESQQRLQEDQFRLVSLLKEPQVNREEVDRCLERIGARQLEMQKLAVDQIMKCRQVMNHQECRCFVDECARKMSISDKVDRNCPANQK